MDQRNWEAAAIIGGNAQGKSSLVNHLIKECYDLKYQKIVVVNNSNPPAFKKYKFIENSDFEAYAALPIQERKKTEPPLYPKILTRKWNGVIRYHNRAGYKQTLKDVYRLAQNGYLKNGAVIFDDCSKYIDANPAESIKSFLVDRRMYELDLFFTTHALRFLPKFVRGMVNTITVFKTAESFENARELKALEYPNYAALYEAWREVMAAPHNPKSYIQKNICIETGI